MSTFTHTEKRPGEAATSSEPGSKNLMEISPMNVKTDSTPAMNLTEREKELLKRHAKEIIAFGKMGVRQLASVSDGLYSAADLLMDITNRPNCSGSALEWLQTEAERLSDIAEIAMDFLEKRKPTGDRDLDDLQIETVSACKLSRYGDDVLEVAQWALTQQRRSLHAREASAKPAEDAA